MRHRAGRFRQFASVVCFLIGSNVVVLALLVEKTRHPQKLNFAIQLALLFTYYVAKQLGPEGSFDEELSKEHTGCAGNGT